MNSPSLNNLQIIPYVHSSVILNGYSNSISMQDDSSDEDLLDLFDDLDTVIVDTRAQKKAKEIFNFRVKNIEEGIKSYIYHIEPFLLKQTREKILKIDLQHLYSEIKRDPLIEKVRVQRNELRKKLSLKEKKYHVIFSNLLMINLKAVKPLETLFSPNKTIEVPIDLKNLYQSIMDLSSPYCKMENIVGLDSLTSKDIVNYLLKEALKKLDDACIRTQKDLSKKALTVSKNLLELPELNKLFEEYINVLGTVNDFDVKNNFVNAEAKFQKLLKKSIFKVVAKVDPLIKKDDFINLLKDEMRKFNEECHAIENKRKEDKENITRLDRNRPKLNTLLKERLDYLSGLKNLDEHIIKDNKIFLNRVSLLFKEVSCNEYLSQIINEIVHALTFDLIELEKDKIELFNFLNDNWSKVFEWSDILVLVNKSQNQPDNQPQDGKSKTENKPQDYKPKSLKEYISSSNLSNTKDIKSIQSFLDLICNYKNKYLSSYFLDKIIIGVSNNIDTVTRVNLLKKLEKTLNDQDVIEFFSKQKDIILKDKDWLITLAQEYKQHSLARFDHLFNYYTAFVNIIVNLGEIGEKKHIGFAQNSKDVVSSILKNASINSKIGYTNEEKKKLSTINENAHRNSKDMGYEETKRTDVENTLIRTKINIALGTENSELVLVERAHTLPFPSLFSWKSDKTKEIIDDKFSTHNIAYSQEKKYDDELYFNKKFFEVKMERNVSHQEMEELFKNQFEDLLLKNLSPQEFLFESLDLVKKFFLKLFSETELLPDFMNHLADHASEWLDKSDNYKTCLAKSLEDLVAKGERINEIQVVNQLEPYLKRTLKEVHTQISKEKGDTSSSIFKLISFQTVEESLRIATKGVVYKEALNAINEKIENGIYDDVLKNVLNVAIKTDNFKNSLDIAFDEIFVPIYENFKTMVTCDISL